MHFMRKESRKELEKLRNIKRTAARLGRWTLVGLTAAALVTGCGIAPATRVTEAGQMPLVLSAGDMTLEELSAAELVMEDIPATLTADVLESNGSVNRLYEQETSLSSVLYQNRDGSKTEYAFAADVKYLDEAGAVHDKSLALSTDIADESCQGYAYSCETNETKVYFPHRLTASTGIVMTVGGARLELCPADAAAEAPDGQVTAHGTAGGTAQQAVTYAHVFGAQTALRYTPTLTGCKEDLILSARPEQNRWSFVLHTDGLTASVAEDGGIVLTDPDTGAVSGALTPIYVYDSGALVHETFDNRYELTPIDAESYAVTMVVDKEFLSDENIVYPVTVDPSFSGGPYKSDKSGINDTIVYSKRPNGTSGSNHYGNIGYVDSSYGIGYVLMKFPALKETAAYRNPQYTITKAAVSVTKVGGSNGVSANVGVYEYNGAAWEEKTATYSGVAPTAHAVNRQCLTAMQSNKKYELTITALAQKWKKTLDLLGKGILLKNDTNTAKADYNRVLATREYAENRDATALPYISITYSYTAETMKAGTYYLESVKTGGYLTRESSGNVAQNAYSGGSKQQRWVLSAVSGTYYRLSPADNTSLALTVEGASAANSANITTAAWTGAASQKWQFVKYSDGSYSLLPQCGKGERAMSVDASATGPGTNIFTYTNKGYSHYRWFLSSPTLAVTGVSMSSALLYEGQSVTIKPTVKHSGTGKIPPVTTRLVVKGPAGNTVKDERKTSGKLASGGTFVPGFTLSSLAVGTYTYTVTADTNGYTTVNRTGSFTVYKKSDLTVSVQNGVTKGFLGAELPIVLTERNGVSPVGAHTVGLFVTDSTGTVVYETSAAVPAMNAQSTVTKELSWRPILAGQYTVCAMADFNAAIPESNEANNTVSFTVTVYADVHEPDNDTPEGAVRLTPDENGTAEATDSLLYAEGDTDWFFVDVPSGAVFAEWKLESTAGRRCSLEIYQKQADGTMKLCRSVSGEMPTEYLRVRTDDWPGACYAKVSGAADTSPYRLSVRLCGEEAAQ